MISPSVKAEVLHQHHVPFSGRKLAQNPVPDLLTKSQVSNTPDSILTPSPPSGLGTKTTDMGHCGGWEGE